MKEKKYCLGLEGEIKRKEERVGKVQKVSILLDRRLGQNSLITES